MIHGSAPGYNREARERASLFAKGVAKPSSNTGSSPLSPFHGSGLPREGRNRKCLICGSYAAANKP